jgi:hypothetical protein
MIDNFQTDFPNCTVIEGDIRILGNDITNLDGLSSLTGADGHLEIWMNPNLINLSGLSNLTYIGDYLMISENDLLVNFTGLNNLETIGGSLEVVLNLQITSLLGLESLSSIGGYLDISLNDNLENLTGINNLNSVGEDITIYGNGSLASLTGLGNLTSDVTHIWIVYNHVLTDLTALHNINSISVKLGITSNDSLSNLSGLETINLDEMQYLTIKKNPLLSECEIQNICDYLSASVGTIDISENATGCNSEGEVEAACITSVPDINIKPEFKLYPNPAKKVLFISFENETTLDQVIIYNQLGQEVLHITHGTDKIDVSNLGHGIYVIELVSGNLRLRDKLIIEK